MAINYSKESNTDGFPVLTNEQLDEIAELAECRTFKAGETLFKTGDTEFKFHVIRKGEVEILDKSDNEENVLLTHGAGEFTGDIANLSGRGSNVDCVAKTDVDVYEICQPELQKIISERPLLSDIILKAFIARSRALQKSNMTGLRVIGSRFSQDTFRIRDFLSKNQVIFTWVDVESDNNVHQLLRNFNLKVEETPIVSSGTAWMLRNPSNEVLAEKIGLKHDLTGDVYDVIVAGAGPAGLAAAVYGASEGLNTLVLEMLAPGGQAGTSSKIENYLGFPLGVSGQELTARATLQADKFGATLDVPAKIEKLHFEGNRNVLTLSSGETVFAKSIVIATGAEYKKLEIDNLEKYEGRGIYYAATQMEANICSGRTVAVVGGGNSAGQAAVFLSTQVQKVLLVVRGKNLADTMSEYLEHRINDCEDIELLCETEIVALDGEEYLEGFTLKNNSTGEERHEEGSAIFSFIGAVPGTQWLPPEIMKDEKGFLCTGPVVESSPMWTEQRQPYLLETSRPGIFAAGDVRSNSVKRVASAVGEGSMSIQFVHQFLALNS